METKVADLSVEELKLIIRETIAQTLVELLQDPDEGLELREDFTALLQHSLTNSERQQDRISAEDVANRLELQW